MHTHRHQLHDIHRLLTQADSLELSAQAVLRLKWFAFALEHDNNVSLTCRHFGIARSTFLTWADRFDARDPLSLEEKSRRPHTTRQPETDASVIALIRTLRQSRPLIGKHAIRKVLKEKHDIDLSASTIGRIIARHCLFFADIPSHRQKRLNAGLEHESDADTPGFLPGALSSLRLS